MDRTSQIRRWSTALVLGSGLDAERLCRADVAGVFCLLDIAVFERILYDHRLTVGSKGEKVGSGAEALPMSIASLGVHDELHFQRPFSIVRANYNTF